MTILQDEMERYVLGQIADVLTGQDVEPAEDRALPAHRYREGRRSGGDPSDPTGRALTDAECDTEAHAAWAAVIESALATLAPLAADTLRSMWAADQPREFAAYMAGVSVPQVFVWEQQAVARVAVLAAMRGLLGNIPGPAA